MGILGKLSPFWVSVSLLLLFAFSFSFRNDHSFDQDLGRHIKVGKLVLQTSQVPKTNLFSYTSPDFPFINTHYLFGVLTAFVQKTIGLELLLILKIAIILLSISLVLSTIDRKKYVLLLPIGFIFLHVFRERLELRPEIFSFLFTALTLYILHKFLNHPKFYYPLLALPLIQLIWINMHIYFFVGFVIQFIFLIAFALTKNFSKLRVLSIILGLSVVVSLINPNGIAGFLYPLNVTKNYGYTIVENQNLFLLESLNFKDSNFLFVKISAILVTFSIVIALRKGRKSFLNLSLALLGLVLALMHVRSFPYLVLLSLPMTIENFGLVKPTKLTAIIIFFFAGLLVAESYLYLNGDYYKYSDSRNKAGLSIEEHAKGALDFVMAKNLPGLIYNNFDIGSYIIYRTYPEHKVFVDGRPEAYPKEFFQSIYIPSQADYNNFKELESQLFFQTIIFSHTDQTPWGKNFLTSILKDDSWKVVYLDDFMVVLVKDKVLEDRNLEPIDLAKLEPQFYNFQNHVPYLWIGIFLLSNQYIESGTKFIDKSLQIFPESPTANSIKASLLSNGDFQMQVLAQKYLQKSKNKYFW